MCDCDSVQSDNRRHSGEKTSPSEGVKRSERLRDRRVHYADMVQGINPHHSAADAAVTESKTVDAGRQQSSHQAAVKVNTGVARPESSARIGGRTSSTERRVKPELVEPVHGTTSVRCRRKSMELRSTTDRRMDEVVEVTHPLVRRSSVSPSGGRQRLSGSASQNAQQEAIAPATVTSRAAKVEHDAEQSSARPTAVPNRQRRGSTRHRRRMAARRHSKLLPVSTQVADSPLDTRVDTQVADSPLDTRVDTLQLNSSFVASDCRQQNVATVDFRLVGEQKVKLSTLDGSVSEVADKMLKMDSDVMPNSLGGCDSENGVMKILPNKTIGIDVSVVQASCCSGVESYRPKHETPLTNLVPVMRMDFSNRVGRRHHSQNGVVLLDRYVSVDAVCVCCCSCSLLFSVAEFIRHMHHTNRLQVGSVQRLGPRGVAGPEWHEFQRRRANFAAGVCPFTPANAPRVDQVGETTIVEKDIPQGPAVNQCTKEMGAESAASTVRNMSVENSPVSPVVKPGTTSNSMVKKPSSTPIPGHDPKSIVTEPSPPPLLTVDKIGTSIRDDVTVSSSQPLKADVVPVSSPVVVDKTSATPEPRITRSRCTSVGPELSPDVTSPHRRLSGSASQDTRPEDTAPATVDIQVSAPRHSERSCKRVRMDSAAATQNVAGGDSIGSRLERRPRPPPRTTAPK